MKDTRFIDIAVWNGLFVVTVVDPSSTREHRRVTRSSLLRAQRLQLGLYDELSPPPGERICWACECHRPDDDSDCVRCGADEGWYQ